LVFPVLVNAQKTLSFAYPHSFDARGDHAK
jgi:hypothetical protein